jgi:hypothetical protein
LYPEDGDSKLLRKFRNYVAIDRASNPRRLERPSNPQSQKKTLILFQVSASKKQPSFLAVCYIRVGWIFGEREMIFATLEIPF